MEAYVVFMVWFLITVIVGAGLLFLAHYAGWKLGRFLRKKGILK